MSPMELKRTSRMVSTRPMYRRVARPRQWDESGTNSSESEQRFATTGTPSRTGTSVPPDAPSPAEKHSLGGRRGGGARRAPPVPRATGVLRAAGGAWGRCPGPTAPTALQRGAPRGADAGPPRPRAAGGEPRHRSGDAGGDGDAERGRGHAARGNRDRGGRLPREARAPATGPVRRDAPARRRPDPPAAARARLRDAVSRARGPARRDPRLARVGRAGRRAHALGSAARRRPRAWAIRGAAHPAGEPAPRFLRVLPPALPEVARAPGRGPPPPLGGRGSGIPRAGAPVTRAGGGGGGDGRPGAVHRDRLPAARPVGSAAGSGDAAVRRGGGPLFQLPADRPAAFPQRHFQRHLPNGNLVR